MSLTPPAATPRARARRGNQRGGFVLGLVVGLLIGLALALGVALYITKAPVPFINKVPQRTAEQDNAEAERNRDWDPNAPLSGPRVTSPGLPAASAGGAPLPRDPAAILSGAPVPPAPKPAAAPAAAARPLPTAPPAQVAPAPGVDPFEYYVQAGAYTRAEDAEQQRARLAMMGLQARVMDREQSGRMVYRVRLGPYAVRDEADALQQQLQQGQVEAQIVRVARP
jgi:cell division protein FtsN